MSDTEMFKTLGQVIGKPEKEAKEFVEVFLELLKTELKTKNEVALSHFGKLKVVVTPARRGRNPRTGETVDISAKTKVKFKPSSKFIAFLNEKS